MALIRKADIPAPSIPEEEVEVASWGGSVIVRAMLLEDYLGLGAGAEMGEYEHICRTLAVTVLDADHAPVLDVAGWQAFAAGNRADALRLFEVAHRLAGNKAQAEKN
jgi:hypothetical protein